MSQKYIILYLIFQLLVEINCQMSPMQISGHTATLINNKLYILGGFDIVKHLYSKDFFYLDISVPFNTKKLLWQDLSSINTVPAHYGAASVKGGTDNNTLYVYGGLSSVNMATTPLVYTFNPQANMWSTPKIAGTNPIRKWDLTGIIDSNGKMYLWNGLPTPSKNENEMIILDTINNIWGRGSLIDVPTPNIYYGATLLSNNNIIYMGK